MKLCDLEGPQGNEWLAIFTGRHQSNSLFNQHVDNDVALFFLAQVLTLETSILQYVST